MDSNTRLFFREIVVTYLLVFNCFLFFLSLLNVIILKVPESVVFQVRGGFYILLVIVFLAFFRRIRFSKYFFTLMLLSSLQLFVFQEIHKYFLDTILLFGFSYIYFNISLTSRNIFSNSISVLYFLFICVLFSLQLADVDVFSTYTSDGTFASDISSFGFKNPNNFSYFLFVSILLLYRSNRLFFFWVGSVLLVISFFYTSTLSTLIGLGLFLVYILFVSYFRNSLNTVLYCVLLFIILMVSFSFYYIEDLLGYSFGTLVPRVQDIIKFKGMITSDVSSLLFGGYTSNFDSFYTNYILGVGFFSFVYLLIISIKASKRMLIRGNYFEFFLVLIVFSLGFVENFLLAASPLSIVYVGELFSNEELKYRPIK